MGLKRPNSAQPSLPFSAATQPRQLAREDDEFYEAVIGLRRAGHRVTRCGRYMHMVDGERCSRLILMTRAGKIPE
jgi:hypothetical protein